MKKLLSLISVAIVLSSCGTIKKNMESNFQAHRMDKVKKKTDQDKITAPAVTKN